MPENGETRRQGGAHETAQWLAELGIADQPPPATATATDGND